MDWMNNWSSSTDTENERRPVCSAPPPSPTTPRDSDDENLKHVGKGRRLSFAPTRSPTELGERNYTMYALVRLAIVFKHFVDDNVWCGFVLAAFLKLNCIAKKVSSRKSY